jgi:hypothetical protein
MTRRELMLAAAAMGMSAVRLNAQNGQNGRAGGEHAYFNRTRLLPACVHAYSLREPEQLTSFRHGTSSQVMTYSPDKDTYRNRQDAAKVVISYPYPTDASSGQIRLPVDLDTGDIWLVWDAWWGEEYELQPQPFRAPDGKNRPGLTMHKSFHIQSPLSGSESFLGIRTHFTHATAPNVGAVDVEPHGGLGPNASRNGPATVARTASDRLEPQIGSFIVAGRTWTRYIVHLDIRPGKKEWDLFSMWVADENRDPVQLHDKVQVMSAKHISKLRLAFNASQQISANSQPLVAYLRNALVLHNLRVPQILFERPVGSRSLASMPQNFRIG